MSNQSNKEIAYEVGQEVYVKGTIVKTYPEQGFVDVLLKDGANVPLGTPAYDTCQIVPVPRDGEQSLTIEELHDLIDYSMGQGWSDDLGDSWQYPEPREVLAKWLERREVRND